MQVENAVRVDGAELDLQKARFEVLEFLRKRDGHSEATFEQIREPGTGAGIDLSDWRNAKLRQTLVDNPKTVLVREGVLRYLPPYGARDRAGSTATSVDSAALDRPSVSRSL